MTAEQLLGKYQWHGFYGIASNITLNKDSTFIYNWQTGLIGGTTSGTWQREGAKITLNSDIQPTENGTEDYEIIEAKKNKSESLLIKVMGPDNKNLPFAACDLKKDTTTLTGASTDLQGVTKLPKLEADSLIISFIGYKTIRHLLDSSVTSYVFKMEEGNDYYEYFTEEIWKYKSGRLYDSSIKKDKYVKKDYYEKIK